MIESLTIDSRSFQIYAPAARAPRKPFFSWRKVGGLTFVRVGPLVVSFCISAR